MTATAPRLLLLPFAALGDEAGLGVWARQLPQLLGKSLVGAVVPIAPLWRDASSGRLIRAGAALPQSVVKGEAEAAAADWVLTGAVSQSDEGVKAELQLSAGDATVAEQRWSVVFPLVDAGTTFGALATEVASRLGRPFDGPVAAAAAPLWPLLCDLEVESELGTAGIAALTQPGAAWQHLRADAGHGAAAWAADRLTDRRLLLQRVAPELLAAFDADAAPVTAGASSPDLSTADVLRLLGIPSDADKLPPHG